MQLDMGFWVDITSCAFDECYDKNSLPINTAMTVEKSIYPQNIWKRLHNKDVISITLPFLLF